MKRRVDTALGLGIFVVVLAALFGVLAVVDRGRRLGVGRAASVVDDR